MFGNKLNPGEQAVIDRLVAACRTDRSRRSERMPDGAEVYAYPQGVDAVAWGVNDAVTGHNRARGTAR